MEQAVHDLPADDRAAADAGPDGDVAERVEPDRCAPAMLAQSGGVDVRVEDDRHAQLGTDRSGHVRMRPAWLGRGRDRAPGRRSEPQVDWAERADPDRLDRPVALEERDRLS